MICLIRNLVKTNLNINLKIQNMSNYADSLKQLPMDNQQLNQSEVDVFNKIYKGDSPPSGKKDKFQMLNGEIQDSLIAGILFAIFSLPFVDKCIGKFMGESPNMVKLLVKTVAFMIIFYIIKNIAYIKK